MKIVIDGKPLVQKRAEFRRYGKFVNTYDPSAGDKKMIQEYVLYKYRKQIKMLTPPIRLELTAFMPIPISLSAKQQSQLIGQYHTKRPDTDNITKLYKDSLQGLLYKDDSYIASETCTKIYDTNPRVEIVLSVLK